MKSFTIAFVLAVAFAAYTSAAPQSAKAGLIAAIDAAAKKVGPKAQPIAKKLDADVVKGFAAFEAHNGPKIAQILRKAAADAKESEKVTAAKAPKLESLAERVIPLLKAYAKKFAGGKGPYSKAGPKVKELTGQVKKNTPK